MLEAPHGWPLFIGCFCIAFGLPIALVIGVVAQRSQLLIIAIFRCERSSPCRCRGIKEPLC
jgi:hypothetical protein